MLIKTALRLHSRRSHLSLVRAHHSCITQLPFRQTCSHQCSGPIKAQFGHFGASSVRLCDSLSIHQTLFFNLQDSNQKEAMAEDPSSKSMKEASDPSGNGTSTSTPTPLPGVQPNPLIDDLKENHLNKGVLIPLKTTQEVRQDHTIVQVYITRAPTKSANDVIT